MPKLKPLNKFKFLTERSIRAEKLDLTRWQSAQLRSKLPKGIYWIQIEQRGSILWNWDLLQNYLLEGDSPNQKALVEEYLITLPRAA